jgi:hypothetical protein
MSLRSLLACTWEGKRIFLSNEWHGLSFSLEPEGEAICKLDSYQERFWARVEDVCVNSEPLVKVLRLVNGDYPQRATCTRPWIGPKNPSMPIMMTREMMDLRNNY